jgi:hypothetical protein
VLKDGALIAVRKVVQADAFFTVASCVIELDDGAT